MTFLGPIPRSAVALAKEDARSAVRILLKDCRGREEVHPDRRFAER